MLLIKSHCFSNEAGHLGTMRNFGEMIEDFFIALFDEIIELKKKIKNQLF